MAKTVKVDWYGERVLGLVQGASDAMLDALAAETLGQAQDNITINDQIDTGYMRASGYIITSQGSSYSRARAEAEQKTRSARTGRIVNHAGDFADELRLPRNVGAAVAFGAKYAAVQETRASFLYAGLERVIRQAGGIIEKVAREKLRD